MKWLLCTVLLLMVFIMKPVYADIQQLEAIEFDGLSKYSESAALSFIPVNLGESLATDQYQDIVKSLFSSGYFADIQLFVEQNRLIVKVKERPWIASVEIYGNELIGEEELNKNLQAQGIEVNRSFNDGLFERIRREIESAYYIQGYYGVQVKTESDILENGNVKLQIVIVEGQVTRIADINIVGNQAYAQNDLLRLFTSRPQYPDYVFNSNDKYISASLEGDVQKLSNYYQNRGYARFKIVDRRTALLPDLTGVFINIRIDEGDVYEFDETQILGYQRVLLKSTVDKLNQINTGDLYSAARINDTKEQIRLAIERKGYAFANVVADPVIDDANKTVSVRLNVVPGNRVYVRRIVIAGNNVTLNEVVRRELRQFEGALYLPSKLAVSKTRLNRLGFFSSVQTETRRVNDQMVDIIVRVDEMRTGTFNAQIGYSGELGISYVLGISESNVLGRGYTAGINAETNESVDSLSINFKNPYFSKEGNSLAFSIGYSQTDLSVQNYITDSLNGRVSYGVPINNDLSLSYLFNHQRINLKCDDDFTYCNDFSLDNGKSQVFNTLGVSLSYDLRNRAFFTSQGSYHTARVESELPGSQYGFYSGSLVSSFYNHFDDRERFTIRSRLRLAGRGGYVEDLPFYKNLFLGGQSSVRGFSFGSLAPKFGEGRGVSKNTPLGGSVLTQANIDMYLPITRYDDFDPDNDNVRLNVFVDGGYVYANPQQIRFDDWRASSGLSIIYFTPLGILSVYYAVPIKSRPEDKISNFGFSISNSI